ncbi:radical SAM protein [Evansella sp. AB-P1]|uniref:radical SAM/SPASM domain-containing protein n=1 Tax=Evansella sp. AB-P1 TaxID=3037653 RepID=UPI00241E7A3C|nr:radical SAM protein [Evansella sp. AB-P1]MDG5787470.1 radical SAM protein [Evansella sp. AB-P1]
MEQTYLPSRFNVLTHTHSKELIIYNSYSGAIASFSPSEKDEVLRLMKKEGTTGPLSMIGASLEKEGFLVNSHIDEKQRAQFLHQSLHRTDTMHLVLLPTEACNFRCTYCYETFPRGNMQKDVRTGLKKYIDNKGNQLNHLMVSWFGGEPLLALDEISELSEAFLQTARLHNIQYKAEMSTNGYYLTEETCRKLLQLEVRQFMVTIDGPEKVHDERRFLVNGEGTFSTIINNLKEIRKIDDQFDVYLRINFDESNLSEISETISYLSKLFDGDNRFQVLCRPVARWGGDNDDSLPICDPQVANKKIWEFTEQSIDEGLKLVSQIESSLMPTGSVCYAAKPHSIVVGADGQLYKCTLAFHKSINQIGKLFPDGSVELDYDKIAKWTLSGEETDEHCQDCFFRPACQGNHCPLYRMETGNRPCSLEKQRIKKVLQLIWKNYTNV